ncbi:MAG: DUF4339 domain-containing protein [Verrucomicrobia bacterium]|nr:DUF4339 domain-containing protein [Verrucomicrobiota bacterium]
MSNLSDTMFRVLDESFREHGPVDWATMLDWMRRGKVQPATWVWNSRDQSWRLAGELTELAAVMAPSVETEALSGEKFAQPVFAPPLPEERRTHWQAGPTCRLATGAFLCGIAGLWAGPLALLAIGLGHFAQWRFRHSPPVVGGLSLALYGLWLGYLAVALLLFHLIRSPVAQ